MGNCNFPLQTYTPLPPVPHQTVCICTMQARDKGVEITLGNIVFPSDDSLRDQFLPCPRAADATPSKHLLQNTVDKERSTERTFILESNDPHMIIFCMTLVGYSVNDLT